MRRQGYDECGEVVDDQTRTEQQVEPHHQEKLGYLQIFVNIPKQIYHSWFAESQGCQLQRLTLSGSTLDCSLIHSMTLRRVLRARGGSHSLNDLSQVSRLFYPTIFHFSGSRVPSYSFYDFSLAALNAPILPTKLWRNGGYMWGTWRAERDSPQLLKLWRTSGYNMQQEVHMETMEGSKRLNPTSKPHPFNDPILPIGLMRRSGHGKHIGGTIQK